MATSLPSIALPTGSARAGFEAAARAHEAARRHPVALPQATLPTPATPVEAAIARAAERTSVDFGYLLAQAEVESALNPTARARTSSATGLYQFIDDTWLGTVKKHGERFGLGALADQIALNPSGHAHVADQAQRAAILALRNDPEVASLMAAGLAEDNRAHLTPILGRQPDHTELYLAHFLGAGGAGRFLSEFQADPGQSAAALFARPAAANRAIFYAPDGAPRSLAQVMDVLSGKLNRALDRASDGKAVQFARTDYGGTGSFTPTSYQPGDVTGFSASQPTALSFAAQTPTSAGPRASRTPQQRQPMSQVLGATFGPDPAAAPAQVRRAYATLKAFGL